MIVTLRRGWVALGGLAALIGFAALVFWASAPLEISATVQSGAAANAPVLSYVRTGTREVALTFDDGPDPRNTPAILQLLSTYHAHATFFVLGSQAEMFPGLVKAIQRSGNEVASHAMTHRSLATLKPARVTYEITSTAGLIQELTGSQPLFFRPPYGTLTPVVIRAAQKLHETVTLWTIDTRDWTGRSSAAITATVLAQLRPGAIILLHDGGGPRARTVQSLRSILLALRQRGYRAVTLDQLVHDAQPQEAGAHTGL